VHAEWVQIRSRRPDGAGHQRSVVLKLKFALSINLIELNGRARREKRHFGQIDPRRAQRKSRPTLLDVFSGGLQRDNRAADTEPHLIEARLLIEEGNFHIQIAEYCAAVPALNISTGD
jgi:hypothetical protein